ncbi:MAG: hypothetical protein R3279_08160 [Putridiphycobacter sp.]|nr:hypothetical protein [Putridiphycobacter sp.]
MKLEFIFSILCAAIVYSCTEKNTSEPLEVPVEYVELPADKFNAVELNNQISNIQIGATKLIENVFRSDTSDIDQNRQDAIFELEVSISRLRQLGEQHAQAANFTNAVIKLLAYYLFEFQNDFTEVIMILKQQEYNDHDQLFLGNYDKKFAEQEAILFQEIIVQQDSFAANFKINMAN